MLGLWHDFPEGSNSDQLSQKIQKQHLHQERTHQCKFHVFASDHWWPHLHEKLRRTTSELTEAASLQGFSLAVSSSGTIISGYCHKKGKTKRCSEDYCEYLWRIIFKVHKKHCSLDIQTWFDKVRECSDLNQIDHIVYDHDMQKLEYWGFLRVDQRSDTAIVSNINDLKSPYINTSRKPCKRDQ